MIKIHCTSSFGCIHRPGLGQQRLPCFLFRNKTHFIAGGGSKDIYVRAAVFIAMSMHTEIASDFLKAYLLGLGQEPSP